MLVLFTCSAVLCLTQAAVLDPALYLSPSPPLKDEPGALERWSRVESARVEEPVKTVDDEQEIMDTSNGELEVPQARTFWWNQPSYAGIRGIHIPLTFSLTGSYGSNAGISTGIIGSTYGVTPLQSGTAGSSISNTAVHGVIGSSYASVSDDSYGNSGLAGSSYGLYRSALAGTRVYGGNGGAAWSGWGNGKWGHYGKG